jgi:transcriptional regulator with PAS, ATPase and Fis domain
LAPRIGIITHYTGFQKQFSSLAGEMGCELIFKTGVLDYAIPLAIDMEEKDRADAIVSHEKTSEIIAPYVKVPVISLHTKSANLFNAFHACRKIGERIAFVDFEKAFPQYDFEHIREILGYDIIQYKFSDLNALSSVMEDILRDRRDVIATTASCMYGYAKSRNLKVVLIEHQKHDLAAVIQHTLNIIKVKRQEEERFHWLSAIMDNTEDGFIALDQDGAVASINLTAQKILHLASQDLIGQKAEDLAGASRLLEKIFRVGSGFEVIENNGEELVISPREIFSDEIYLGRILKIEVLKKIRNIEMQARKMSSPTGFVAVNTFDDIVGVSESIGALKEAARRYANTGSPVLITGESGTGKEMFAQSIHNYSARKDGPFVALNCVTLPENLLDSELFGYEDGAFTGAKKGGKAGLFELAYGGTLFLDEIGEMPLMLQAKVLRVLQEKEIRRIGGSKNTQVDVRFIFATNRDLSEATLNNGFRKDLYYRVNVLNVNIPPLRERPEDIPAIVRHLAARLSAGGGGGDGGAPTRFSPGQMESLGRYSWPGNVRELQNFVERIIAITAGQQPSDRLVNAMLGELIRAAGGESRPADTDALLVPIGAMREMENHIITTLYKMYGEDKNRLGYTLKLCNTTLWRRLKEARAPKSPYGQ